MQSFILGAGLGTRLMPLTSLLPKPLIPVFQQPMAELLLDYHYEAGIREFIINTSHLALCWDRAFPEHEWRGCPIRFSYELTPLDSGGGIRKILPLIDKNSPLLIQNGDILTDLPLQQLIEAHKTSGAMVTLALRSKDGNRNVGFDETTGLVTDMGLLVGKQEATSQFACVYIMDPAIADLFPDEDAFSIVPVWIELIRRGQIAGILFDEAHWYEPGTPAAYLDMMLDLPKGDRDRIHPTAQIDPSAIVCPLTVIGAGAVIPEETPLIDSIVWPNTSVPPGNHTRRIFTPHFSAEA